MDGVLLWGVAARRVFIIYLYTKRSPRDVLPRLGGPPVVGYRSATTVLATDTKLFADSGGSDTLALGHRINSSFYFYAYIGSNIDLVFSFHLYILTFWFGAGEVTSFSYHTPLTFIFLFIHPSHTHMRHTFCFFSLFLSILYHTLIITTLYER